MTNRYQRDAQATSTRAADEASMSRPSDAAHSGVSSLDSTAPVELVVLSVKQRAARCCFLGTDRVVTLRASGLWNTVPGEIIVVRPKKRWTYVGNPYLSGDIEASRLDVDSLELPPLELEDQGLWRPDEHYWGDEDLPLEDWAEPIYSHGPRRAFEMEQVLPGLGMHDRFYDPICESNRLKHLGDHKAARRLLMELCQADLRCLDAHAHLGY